jgi:hypothetical protein
MSRIRNIGLKVKIVNFILRLTPEQRVPDELAALGELAKESNHHNLSTYTS